MAKTPKDAKDRRNDPDPHRDSRGPTTLPTAPAQESGLSLPPADAVVSFRVVGTATELMLPDKKAFTLGSKPQPDVDVQVRSRHASGDARAKEHVSGIHLLIQRKGNRLWINDQDSTNGTFIRDRREKDGDIRAGQSFRVGDVTLLAMDEQMRSLRPDLHWTLGLGAHAYVDQVLEVIASGDPLLLLGQPGCDQRTLAERIHRTSARRDRGFAAVPAALASRSEQVAQLVLASGGTAFVDLAGFDSMPAFFASQLFGDTYHARAIIAAPDFTTAAKQLGDQHVPRLRVITVPAIKDRRADVPRLFDRYFRRLEEKRRAAADPAAATSPVPSLEISQLGDHKLARLMAFDWPDNLPDLERNAPRLHALLEHGGNVRAAARSLGVSHKALLDALTRLGLRD